MEVRMSIATAVAAVSLATLAACGTDAPEPAATPEPAPSATSATPSPSATPEPSETAPAAPSTAADLVGTWRDDAADWTVRFAADGSFEEDYQGVEVLRTGTYELADGTVSLVGGDGNTDRGTVEDTGLVFRLGTLERQ